MSFDPNTYEKLGAFFLGRERERQDVPILYDSRDLTTHALCVGMTGSGKTGLCISLLEEALIDKVPAIVIDPKGDIGNLALTFPDLDPDDFAPWMEDPSQAPAEAEKWRKGLASWGQGPERIARLREAGDVTIYTPGSTAGRSVSILGSLSAPPAATIDDTEMFSDRVSSTATSLLALLGTKDVDPLQDPEHVFLSNLLSHYWQRGHSLDLAGLIRAIQAPPFDRVGVMSLDDVFDKKDRAALAMRTNNLLAAPAFAPWLQGDDLDIDAFLGQGGKPKVSIFSIGHLDDAERMFFVSLLAGRVLDWMRQQSGTNSLRALLYMDEIFGFLPPVANPPSKRPLLALLKQARAFGVGVVLASQNPVDLDYKAMSNMGTWFLGRLQTERDVARVVDGLLGADDSLDRADIEQLLAGLGSREFLLHNVHESGPRVFQTRWAMSYLRGPMTREDIRKLTASSAATVPTATRRPPVETAAAEGQRAGAHLPIRVPGGDDETVVWRPMAYGAGQLTIDKQRREFGYIRGLRGGLEFDWTDATAVVLDPSAFSIGQTGTHLDVEPAAERPDTWAQWSTALIDHVAAQGGTQILSCPKLRLKMNPGESAEAFRGRVELAVREKRDAAVDKLRDRYAKKVERLEGQIERAQDALQTQVDQKRDAQLNAAVNVGEALWGMLGGRKRSVSSARATRVMRESRDVDRASEKLEELTASLSELQTEMRAAVDDEAREFGPDSYPIEARDVELKDSAIDVTFCELVWVPYWTRPDGSRRRAH